MTGGSDGMREGDAKVWLTVKKGQAKGVMGRESQHTLAIEG